MSTVSRSERILNSLVGKNGLTEAGKNWLTGAADPFHDLALNVTGYPDQCQSDSVVQLVKLTSTISCPTALVGGNWDCRIHQYPWLVDVPFTKVNNAGTSVAPVWAYTGTANIFNAGGLGIDTCATGNQMGFAAAGALHSTIAVPAQYYNGQVRVIGQAFEVHNTTSQLYKQGAVLTYRQPTPDMFQSSTYPVIGGATSANGIGYPSAILLPSPPIFTPDALLLSGSKQWEAKDGCYVVGSFHSETIPLQDTIVINPIQYQANLPEGTGAYYMPTPGTITQGTSQILFWNDLFWTQQDACGAYFTGLSPQTTLTINWNLLIERFPSAADADLVVLAKSSPRYDPTAIELYSLCMQSMPTGVPVSENGLGDWFMKVIGRARDIVMPALRVGSALHPKIGMLTGAMDALGISGNAKGGGDAQSNPSPFQSKGRQKQKGTPRVQFGPHITPQQLAALRAGAASKTAKKARNKAKRQSKRATKGAQVPIPGTGGFFG